MFIIYPTEKFAVVSLSDSCELMCDHCMGRFLRGMTLCRSPEELYELALKFEAKGKLGFLVSGGYDRQGRLLKIEKYISTLKKIKEDTSLRILMHSGFLSKETLGRLSGIVDKVCLDFIGSSETIRKVLHLPFGVDDLVRFMDTLEELCIDYAPHLIAGLHYGKVVGEPTAIEILKNRKIKEFIFLTLVPTRGTFMEDVKLDIEKIIEVIELTKEIKCRKILGCMRVRLPQLEKYALEAGYDGIVMPTRQTLEKLEGRLDVVKYHACCASIP